MQMSAAIGPYGSYDPMETPKPLWGSPGAELSTWTTFQFCCEIYATVGSLILPRLPGSVHERDRPSVPWRDGREVLGECSGLQIFGGRQASCQADACRSQRSVHVRIQGGHAIAESGSCRR